MGKLRQGESAASVVKCQRGPRWFVLVTTIGLESGSIVRAVWRGLQRVASVGSITFSLVTWELGD